MGDMYGVVLVCVFIDVVGEEKVDIEVYVLGGKWMQNVGVVMIGGWCVNLFFIFYMQVKQGVFYFFFRVWFFKV